MKKMILILISLTLLIFSACTNKEVIKHDYTYTGESENWVAEYKVDGKGIFTEKDGRTEYECNEETRLTVTYKKDIEDLSTLKCMKISYESSAGSGSLTQNPADGDPVSKKTFTLSGGGSGTAIENKDETIKVTIDLDGNIETLELKNENL